MNLYFPFTRIRLTLARAVPLCLLACLINVADDRFIGEFISHGLVKLVCYIVIGICMRPILDQLFKNFTDT